MVYFESPFVYVCSLCPVPVFMHCQVGGHCPKCSVNGSSIPCSMWSHSILGKFDTFRCIIFATGFVGINQEDDCIVLILK